MKLSDVVDRANDLVEIYTQATISNIKSPPIIMNPGNCNKCGEDVLRLIKGTCPPCIDRLQLKQN